MIDPMATPTIKRPSADLRRPRGREALSARPPTPVDDTPSGNLEQRADYAECRTMPSRLRIFLPSTCQKEGYVS